MARDWTRLLAYLRGFFALPDLAFTRDPRPVTGGYSHYIWRLDLTSSHWPQTRSLQLRCAKHRRSHLHHELRVLRWLQAKHYPVSTPLLWTEDDAIMGEPFAILEWLPGRTLATKILTDGWCSDGTDGQTIGRLLAQVHTLSPEGFPAHPVIPVWQAPDAATTDLLGPDRLALVQQLLYASPSSPESLVVCHLDVHPLNVVLSERKSVLIDWEKARLADPLMDIAMSQVHTEMAITIGEYPTRSDPLAYGTEVEEGYRQVRPLPDGNLVAFRVLAACQRLGDVAGAMGRPSLSVEDHAELIAEASAALTIIDREVA